jgi:tetratricopeptide (TPR) repeat protein
LWGINDLANIYATLGGYLQLHGKAGSLELFEKAIQYENMALGLDAGYLIALQNLLFTYSKVIVQVGSVQEVKTTLERVDSVYKVCVEKNQQFHQCHINYVMDLARAVDRLQLANEDAQLPLQRGYEALSRVRALGGSFLDLEQNAALFHVLDAQEKLRRKQDAATALLAADQSIARCLGMNGQDAMCRTLAAQRVWLDAKLAELAKQPTRDVLLRALEKALEATQSPEMYPDAWQTVAETYLRLLQSDDGKAKQRAAWLLAGKVAVGKVFAVNPNHALAQATLGELELERARSEPPGMQKVTAAEAARHALTQAVQSDPLLTRRLGPLLAESRKLATR